VPKNGAFPKWRTASQRRVSACFPLTKCRTRTLVGGTATYERFLEILPLNVCLVRSCDPKPNDNHRDNECLPSRWRCKRPASVFNYLRYLADRITTTDRQIRDAVARLAGQLLYEIGRPYNDSLLSEYIGFAYA
jgi:hypothetical protein